MNEKIEHYQSLIVSGNTKMFISTLQKEDVNNESSLYLFDQIDDFILDLVETEAAKMEPIILSAIKFYNKVELWESCGYSMNTLFNSYFHQKKTQKLLELFYEAMKFVSDKKLKIVGLSFLMGLKRVIHSKEINIDEALVCKRLAVKFLLDFDEFEKAIEEMCSTSFLFAEINDHQGAYRLLNDAEELAKSKNLTLSLSNVYETLGSIAFYERDFKYSNKAFEQSIRIKNEISAEIPISLKSNLAASKMNLSDYSGAIAIYKSLLFKSTNEEEENLVTRGCILTNYAVCERKIGNSKKSQKLIKEAIPLLLNQTLIDSLIEAYLVASKTELKIGNQKQSLKYLRFAVDSIEDLISKNYRLHYRRGVRERYHNRIKHLLSKTSIQFISKKDLKILIFLKSNTNSDWLSLINWSKDISKNKIISNELKLELELKLKALINFGAPMIYGFSEKYDDPFEYDPSNEKSKQYAYNVPWQSFNETLIKIISNYDVIQPYEKTKSKYLIKKIEKLFVKKSHLLFAITCEDGTFFYQFDKDKVDQFIIPKNKSFEFHIDLYKYQNKEMTATEFISKLNSLKKIISKTLNGVIENVVSKKGVEMIYFPDYFSDKLPINSLFIDNYKRLEGFKGYRSCPILSFGNKTNKELNTFFGIYDNDKGKLPLTKEELLSSLSIINNDNYKNIDLSVEQIDFKSDSLINANILHFGSHGFPISRYTDPMFSSLAGTLSSNSITLEGIQRNFQNNKYSLVVLNACDSSDKTQKNTHKSFVSNELIGFSSTLLLNQTSVNTSLLWPLKDIVCFIFSSLFYNNLKNNINIQEAFYSTIYKLKNLTNRECIEIIETISDKDIRESKLNIFKKSNTLPFDSIYCYGVFNFQSLL